MAQQGSELVHILADESNHRDIYGDDTPAVLRCGKSIRIVAFDNKQFRLYSGAARDTKMRQEQLLHRLPVHSEKDFLSGAIKNDGGARCESHFSNPPGSIIF